MPWIPFYAEDKDFQSIIDWLNKNDEIAFLVPSGLNGWKAVRTVPNLLASEISLWHIPSGPVIIRVDVESHWKGWEDTRGKPRRHTPYLPFHTGIIELHQQQYRGKDESEIGLSSFCWIGNLQAPSGNIASEHTVKFWKALRSWIGKNAVKIPRSGSIDGPRAEIWAFPSALSAIRNGKKRANNPM